VFGGVVPRKTFYFEDNHGSEKLGEIFDLNLFHLEKANNEIFRLTFEIMSFK